MKNAKYWPLKAIKAAVETKRFGARACTSTVTVTLACGHEQTMAKSRLPKKGQLRCFACPTLGAHYDPLVKQ